MLNLIEFFKCVLNLHLLWCFDFCLVWKKKKKTHWLLQKQGGDSRKWSSRPPSTLWLFCIHISNSASSPWTPRRLCIAAAGGNAAKENAQKKFGTIPTRTFRHLRLYIPVGGGHHIKQQLKLAVRHLQTLFPPSRPPTTDCIWLNRSNYRKENKPEIEHPPPQPHPLLWGPFWSVSPISVSSRCLLHASLRGPQVGTPRHL